MDMTGLPVFRSETAGDLAGIRAVAVNAFPTCAEADLLDRLRAEGSAVLSLVASLDNLVIAQAMFSRMRSPQGALGLGPVAVSAPWRRQGIAAHLIREGLARAGVEGWSSVFVLGDPAYYARFGFDPALAAGFTSPYAGPHLMALALRVDARATRTGVLQYPRPFDDLG
jgi:putative acetyltransferase